MTIEASTSDLPGPEWQLGLRAGDMVGPYRLLSALGEGGFGVVYVAERREPIVQRVALKVIKPGMDSKAVIARFEQERQALAVMDHPNVAKVLDAGATAEGRPYFVMEHVQGEPITTYCDRHTLTIRQRLELFIPVCEAVQHAHMKGIIHRDIKPSNILVMVRGGKAIPKVIDFGVAKAISHTLTEKTIFTEHGQLIGTPEYMSPEQAEMGATDIDTRSDVYSLGVLLYELIVGATPFDSDSLREAGYAEIQRIIREVDPPKPSTRLSRLSDRSADIARHRRAKCEELLRELSRELDWIPLKAMRKDRTERYRTATDLADDIRNYLDGRPLEAGPEAATYRFRKFIRRHKGPVAAVAVIMLLLIAGISGTTWSMQRARLAEAEAERRATELEQVAAFQARQLSEIDVGLFGHHLREAIIVKRRAYLERTVGSDDLEVLEQSLHELDEVLSGINFTDLALHAVEKGIFDRALAAIDEQLDEQPVVRAALLQTIATTLRELGLFERAVAPQQQAVSLRRQVLGETHADTIDSVRELGFLRLFAADYSEAEKHLLQALELSNLALGGNHPQTLTVMANLGLLLMSQAQYEEAERYWEETLRLRQEVLGDDHPETLISTDNLGFLRREQGRYAEAEALYRRGLDAMRRVLGNEHSYTLLALNSMGGITYLQGRYDEAELYWREALDTRRRVLGDQHMYTLASVSNMGQLMEAKGDLVSAGVYLREALETSRRLFGAEHPETLSALSSLGSLLWSKGELAEAEVLYREAAQTGRRILGEGHPTTVSWISAVGVILDEQGRQKDAEPYLQEALWRTQQAFGGDHPSTMAALHNMANLMRRTGRYEEAVAFSTEAVEAAITSLPAGHWQLGIALWRQGQALAAKQRFDDAIDAMEEAFRILSDAQGGHRTRKAFVAKSIAGTYASWHQVEPHAGHDVRAAEWRAVFDRAELPSDG